MSLHLKYITLACYFLLQGVQYLSHQLPYLVAMNQVQPPSFNHIDFLLANDARSVLYDHILNLMTVY